MVHLLVLIFTTTGTCLKTKPSATTSITTKGYTEKGLLYR